MMLPRLVTVTAGDYMKLKGPKVILVVFTTKNYREDYI